MDQNLDWDYNQPVGKVGNQFIYGQLNQANQPGFQGGRKPQGALAQQNPPRQAQPVLDTRDVGTLHNEMKALVRDMRAMLNDVGTMKFGPELLKGVAKTYKEVPGKVTKTINNAKRLSRKKRHAAKKAK